MRDAANQFELTGDEMLERVRALYEAALANAAPGCNEWWKRQPVNFLEETINDLFETIEKRNPRAIEHAFTFAESELALAVRFHRRAVDWVEAVIRIPSGKKLSPRLVPDEMRERAKAAGVLAE